MFTSFSTALSGLKANSTAIDVVGNNLANLNTPGFKTSSVGFRDLVTQSIGAGLGDTQVGFGTGQPLTVRQFSQGAIQTSSGLLDAAIQGDGFFVVVDNTGNTLYSRSGSFQVDDTGNLLTSTGCQVQGWTKLNAVTGAVDTNGTIGNIVVPVGSLDAPVATNAFSVDLNLNVSAKAGPTSIFSTPMKIYDSLGESHMLTLEFEKTEEGPWNYRVLIDGGDIGGTEGEPTEITTGTLEFSDGGELTSPAPGTSVDFSITGLSSKAADLNISWGLFTDGGAGRITQFAATSAPSASFQNGSSAAELVNVGLGDGGRILAQYSNGNQVVVGQLALASIRNPDTLIASGNNNFQPSSRTATPSIGVPNTGGRGDIVGGALEASTVDIATEFTNMIVYQRGYQANSRVVTAVNDLSQETMNLIR